MDPALHRANRYGGKRRKFFICDPTRKTFANAHWRGLTRARPFVRLRKRFRSVQEVYFRIWRNAPSFDVKLASPIAWMASIVRHCAIDTLRKQKLETVHADDESARVAANEPDPADEIDMAQRRAIAFAAIRKMDPAKRNLIVRAYIREQSRDSLAKVYGVPTGTIKTNLRRSLIELRESMQREAEQARVHAGRAFEAA
jgi:RNA polymerase sigma-70 factor, ECF subfamily